MILFQRLFTLGWFFVCLAFVYIGWDYEAPFSYEPVGPRSFPLLLLGLMALSLLWVTFRPPAIEPKHDEQPMDSKLLTKVALCVALLLVFAGLFEPLGFIPSAALIGALMARLYGGTWMGSVVAGVLISIAMYVLFDRLLDVPLPLGVLAFLES